MIERHRVLIVDDTPENIGVLMETLRDEYAIVAAKDGQKALELAAKEPRPDLVLLDVMMPGIDGYEVCTRLKGDEATRDIPVIFVTALSEAGEEARGLEVGAVDYITKPFVPSLVRARVRSHLELKRHRDQLEELVEERTHELLQATAERQRLESELQVARRLQMTMLPDVEETLAGRARCDVSALVEPAEAVGGDLYDCFFLHDGRLCFLVGDVSFKGVPAALFMVRTVTVIRSLAGREASPAGILTHVNRVLCQGNDACMFVTMVCCILDLGTGELALASGGHEHPMLVAPGRSTEFILLPGGPALGLDPDATYGAVERKLEPGDGVLLYTDGVTGAVNQDRRPFAEVRLLEVVSSHARLDPSPSSLTGAVLESVREFAGPAPQSDDIALFALRRRVEGDGP